MLSQTALVAIATLAAAADVPKEPGVYWEQTVEMTMGGMAMPAQTMKVCMAKKQDWARPPEQQPGQECKVTDVKRSGQKMSWKIACEGGMTGEGEMTWSGDSFAGTSTMQTEMGAMRMKMKGRKLGGDCDANETKRQLERMQQQAKPR
jgi:hypothetical protein